MIFTFFSVSFSGLLWGYEDELPCLKLDLPGECGGDDYDDPWGDDDWGKFSKIAIQFTNALSFYRSQNVLC